MKLSEEQLKLLKIVAQIEQLEKIAAEDKQLKSNLASVAKKLLVTTKRLEDVEKSVPEYHKKSLDSISILERHINLIAENFKRGLKANEETIADSISQVRSIADSISSDTMRTARSLIEAQNDKISKVEQLVKITPKDGVGIKSMKIKNGDLIVTYTDGRKENVGKVGIEEIGYVGRSGSTSSVNSVSSEVDFGATESDTASVTVSATWVKSNSNIICQVQAKTTADHDPEDAVVENITAYPTAIVEGVGFTIKAFAPNGSWGKYAVSAFGI